MKHTILFAAMLCVAMTATANNAKISGRIKDANDKSAIIGATVLLMQDTVQIAGTTTDNSGKFTIDAGNANSPLMPEMVITSWNFLISVMKQSAWLLP